MSALFEIRNALETMEGDGAEVKRLLPIHGFMNFDPIVLWDHFDIGPGSGFPDHPHRGFEAITYLFSGAMQHADNLGNRSTVLPGGAQRFTAGSGLVHSEMPGVDDRTTGIQLWINLPKRLKQVPPAYQQVDAEQIPVETFAGGRKRIIVGGDEAVQLLTPVKYLDIELDAAATYAEPLDPNHRGLVYVVKGDVELNGCHLTAGQAVFMEQTDRLTFAARTACQMMVCFGQPHGEPIRQYGPFVD
ncbi:MAG: pirin family protein [Gammaproteobacteria bacterium]|nr:pirin family protein [Gammaproteobacteria bacterium]MDH5651734.1 pirin family protein [Gammaproteobacteria bacterium]